MIFQIEWHDRLPSTNSALKERIAAEPSTPSGMVIATMEQTAGRGRNGRAWISGRGENLTASLLIRHPADPSTTPSSAMAAALGIALFLRSEGIAAELKWPNDVRVGKNKICGILSDGLSDCVVIGMGLNVNMVSAGAIDQPAVSMRMLSDRCFDLKTLLPSVLGSIEPHLCAWMRYGFEGIRSGWEELCPGIGELVSVHDGANRRAGILTGFGSFGELLLADPDGTVRPVWSGELEQSLPRNN